MTKTRRPSGEWAGRLHATRAESCRCGQCSATVNVSVPGFRQGYDAKSLPRQVANPRRLAPPQPGSRNSSRSMIMPRLARERHTKHSGQSLDVRNYQPRFCTRPPVSLRKEGVVACQTATYNAQLEVLRWQIGCSTSLCEPL